MFDKYKKYIYGLIVFYLFWLVFIPLGFKFLADPVLSAVKSYTSLNIELKNPRLITSILPNIKVKADEIKLLNKDNSVAVSLSKLRLNLRILPLLSGRVHVNSFESASIYTNIGLKDKIYIGEYPLNIENQDVKAKVNRVKVNKLCVDIDNPSQNFSYKVSGEDLYFKNNRTTFLSHGKLGFEQNKKSDSLSFDISLPHTKNLKRTKFNIDIQNLDLSLFSDIVSKGIYSEISNLEGVINLHSSNKKMIGEFNNVKINYQDSTKSMILPNKLLISSKHKIGENSFYIKEFFALTPDNKINAQAQGSIKKIFSKNPLIKMTVNLEKSDLRMGALMLPPIVTPDISIPKLKQYPFYGNIFGTLKIKGKFPEPDITGNIKVTDGILIKPIPNASGNAEINIDFVGKQFLIDVVVPAGGREVVYVSGDVMLYGDKFAHLNVKSSPSVDLHLAEFVLNPLHEILCFMIGPVPILDVWGRGNVDIKIVGTKKDPHIWGDFNFKDTSARFLEVNNLTLEHADGNLNFNNQNAHFINNTGVLHGQKATIDGTCTLFGNLDFDVYANNQNLSDLVTILTTSPMLSEISSMVPNITDIKGKSDFYLHLKGKLYDIADLKINENVLPSGYIKLLGNSLKYENVPVHNLKGIINYYKTDCDFNLNAFITSASKSTIVGSIKKNIADIKIDSPRIKVNELEPKKLAYLDPLFIKLSAHYKGELQNVAINGINAVIEIIRDYKPVRNGKIISGKLTLKNSNLNISNLNGVIKKNPFNLNLNLNIDQNKGLKLGNGNFNCKEFDLTILNLLKKANILPPDIQKEINNIEFLGGKASVNAVSRFGRLNAGVNVKDAKLEYKLKQGKEVVNIPFNIMAGQISVNNNKLNLSKFNCMLDGMPVFIYGNINNIYSNPYCNLRINSKLIQRVFDKYWNANNIYPIKINGDIVCSTGIDGDKNNTRIRTDIRMEANSNIYYMGATIGDSLNPITVNMDANLDKSGWIKLNKFRYNKLISSQNRKHNELPLLSVSGMIKPVGKLYLLKNVIVKTENPTNANFFNFIFKKPTIKSGTFTSDLKINGISNKPKIIGKFLANKMEMPYLNTSVKDLSVDFKPNNIQITTKGTVLDNYIMVNATVKNNLNPPYKVSGADIYINDFDIDNTFNQLKQLELKGFSSAIASDADISGANLMHLFYFNNVKIRAGNISIKNIKASNLEAMCSLSEKMLISVDSFKFNMASGIIYGKLSYNLLNNFVKMELNSKNVNANELVIALFDLPNQIYGSLTGQIELSCNATDDKTRLNTLSGYGSFNVSNGRMPKLGSMEYLLRAGNLIKGGITGLTMNGIIDIITPMKTGEFSSINGRIRLKDGIAKTLEIRTIGKNLSLYLIGNLNLYTQIADMHVYGQLSKKVSTILGTAGNISLNTLFNKIPGISLDKNSSIINDLNKIPGIELSNKSNRRFMVEIFGDISGDSFVKTFKWIN